MARPPVSCAAGLRRLLVKIKKPRFSGAFENLLTENVIYCSLQHRIFFNNEFLDRFQNFLRLLIGKIRL